MRRTVLMASWSVLVVAASAWAQMPGSVSGEGPDFMSRAGRRSGAAAMNPIRALLLNRVDEVRWDETPLGDVVEWLAAQSTEHGQVSVVVRWRALNIESLDRDAPVTLTMRGVTVKDVLDEVLDQLSDLDPLTYVGKDNVLKISTKSDFDRKLYNRVYDISDILVKVKSFTGSPQIDLQQQQQSSGGGGSSGQAQVQSIFSGQGGGGEDDDDEDGDEEDKERAEEVITFIQAVIEPLSWDENGGLGSMAVLNKQLSVRNTLSVHEQLGGPFDFDE